MSRFANRRLRFAVAAVAAACALAALMAPLPLAAQSKPRQAKIEKEAQPARSEQSIVVLVNDEPVTAYEIQQRARFLAVNENISEQVKAQFQRLAQSESTNKQVRAILEEIIRSNPGKSREEIGAIFEQRKNQFAMNMQKQAIDSVRAGLVPKFRKEAQEELIDERLKLQEAKRNGIEVSDDDVKRMLKTLADRNKMTEEQFAQHVKGMGFEITTMRERTRVQAAWREVVRRRFAPQISITNRDIDRMLSATASEAGEDTVELQVLKLTLAMPARPDQATMARRYAEAEGLRRRFEGCKSMAGLAKDAANARFEDLKFIKPGSVPEPTRSMLLSAKDGDVLPPATAGAGIEIYAVCGRRAIKADEKQREKAQEELAQKEFETAAKRYLRDLRQDAHIEYR
ncbi:MAG TPA: SurA N-terminal domain-containing protein [Hyphomicrobiaceae bacterium]|nr:SurA N-terminal domain-containing protein [Hyphomicrobiaceae bacterium]